jgi:hypothetical protein
MYTPSMTLRSLTDNTSLNSCSRQTRAGRCRNVRILGSIITRERASDGHDEFLTGAFDNSHTDCARDGHDGKHQARCRRHQRDARIKGCTSRTGRWQHLPMSNQVETGRHIRNSPVSTSAPTSRDIDKSLEITKGIFHEGIGTSATKLVADTSAGRDCLPFTDGPQAAKINATRRPHISAT